LVKHSVQSEQPNTAEKQNFPVKNFFAVTNWLYRGGQPDEAAYKTFLESGVKTVISLRWNYRVIKSERELAKAKGLNFYSIPLSYWVLPTRKQIDLFLSLLDDESKRPIYMHCLHGRDRTGMFTAIYRIAREGWSADQAYAEMKAKGFRRFQMHQFKWAVYGFERRLKRDRR
jgi:protein tyrosine/serine phosphatase